MKHPCESCGDNEATVHFTEIVGNEKRNMHLCEECARQKGVPMAPSLSLADLLGNLLNQMSQGADEEQDKITCEACGITYGDFRGSGRLGCPQDYALFAEPLTALLGRIQDGTAHVGKVPPSADESLARHNRLLKLRRELDRAVLREDYDRARVLRDEIADTQEPGSDHA